MQLTTLDQTNHGPVDHTFELVTGVKAKYQQSI